MKLLIYICFLAACLQACGTSKKIVNKTSTETELKKTEVKDIAETHKQEATVNLTTDSLFDNSVTVEEFFTTDSVPKLVRRKSTTRAKGNKSLSLFTGAVSSDSVITKTRLNVDSTAKVRSVVKDIQRTGIPFNSSLLWGFMVVAVIVIAYKVYASFVKK